MAAPPTAASAPTMAPKRRGCSRRTAAPVKTGSSEELTLGSEVTLEGSEVTLEGSAVALDSEGSEVTLDSAGSDAEVGSSTPEVSVAEPSGHALTSSVEVTVTTEG